jgi:hypothetical protein
LSIVNEGIGERVGGRGKVGEGGIGVDVGEGRLAMGDWGVMVGKAAGGEQAARRVNRVIRRARRERPIKMSDFVWFFRHFGVILDFM